MANVVNGNPLIIDGEGVISTVPLMIKSILLVPNDAGDSATFTYWLESDTVADSGVGEDLAVTASSGTFAATGAFTTALINPHQILRTLVSESGSNIGYYQIATNADNNTITVDEPEAVYGGKVATLANDTANQYTWKVWDPRVFSVIRNSGISGDTSLAHLKFGDSGLFVPNLAMHTLSTLAVLYIYLR